VEDVVDTLIVAGAFDAGDRGGFFDDADQALVADGAGAIGAGVDIGDVVADGAEAEAGLEGVHRVSKGGGVFISGAEDVEGVALGGFGADAGELFQLFDKTGHGLGVS
jgi:hypothetical protein